MPNGKGGNGAYASSWAMQSCRDEKYSTGNTVNSILIGWYRIADTLVIGIA